MNMIFYIIGIVICGVPVPVVSGSWGEPRRKNHVIFVRR